MKRYYRPLGTDPQIISGEAGAAGLAALLALMTEPTLKAARNHLGLGINSRILLFNTEGDTDPEHFRAAVEG